MNIEISPLKNYPEHIPSVISWIYHEWGNNNPHYWDSWIHSSLNTNGIPITYVVLVDKYLVGTFSLWRCDLQSRQDLFPWFSALYVDPRFRGKLYNGKKISSTILEFALKEMKQLGYHRVFLFTEKDPDFYERNGWYLIGTAFDENDHLVTLCCHDL